MINNPNYVRTATSIQYLNPVAWGDDQLVRWSCGKAFKNKTPIGMSKAAAYGTAYQTMETPVEALAQHILAGYNWSPIVFKDGKRRQDNYISAQMLCIEFDSGTHILDILDHPMSRYLMMSYTTPSHTQDDPRYRLIFMAERPFESKVKNGNFYSGADMYRKATTALIRQYRDLYPDQAPNDAARNWFGSERAEHHIPNSLVAMPQKQIKIIHSAYQAELDKAEKERVRVRDIAIRELGLTDRLNGGNMNSGDKTALVKSVLQTEVENITRATKGGRNTTLFNAAVHVIKLNDECGNPVDTTEIADTLRKAAMTYDHSFTRKQVDATIKSALRGK